MDNLSDDVLLDAYFKAVKHQLNEDFIQIIYDEIVKRSLLDKTILTS